MADLNPKIKKGLLAAGAAAVLLAVWSFIPGNQGNRVLQPVSAILTPLQESADSFREKAGDAWAAWRRSLEILEENDQLLTENARLRQQIRELQADSENYQKLKESVKIKERYSSYDVLHANILNEGIGLLFDAARIDIGLNDGLDSEVAADSWPVVDTDLNLLGRVIEAGNDSSKVLWFTAPGSVVSARVNRPGGASLLVKGDSALVSQGLAAAEPSVQPADESAAEGLSAAKPDQSAPKLEEGDELVTSGEGGFYPAGLKLGRILAVHEEEGRIWAELDPYADFREIEDVFVLQEMTGP